jgi:hypothetical protein
MRHSGKHCAKAALVTEDRTTVTRSFVGLSTNGGFGVTTSLSMLAHVRSALRPTAVEKPPEVLMTDISVALRLGNTEFAKQDRRA